MKLTWHHLDTLAVFVDETGKIQAKVESKGSTYTAIVEGVDHGEYLTEMQARTYIEKYLEVK